MFYPLKFEPILVERVWGGSALARYGKPITPGQKIGETWEISDRDDAQSRVANGPLRGQTLRQLIERLGWETVVGKNSGTGVPPVQSAVPTPNGRDARLRGRSHFGAAKARSTTRFPLLIKLLDTREILSLQVHPPAAVAGQFGGEPKTEMWYILDAAPQAELFAGLRRGVTRGAFQEALASAKLAELIHRLPVRAGDAIFIPSGRVHALGAGLVLVEIQQNSDTTYRVYDWDRLGLDGRPRPLHLRESLASIDFNDFEPAATRLPVTCEHFVVERLPLDRPRPDRCNGSTFHVLACSAGAIRIGDEKLRVGEFALLPAGLGEYTLTPIEEHTAALKVFVPAPSGSARVS